MTDLEKRADEYAIKVAEKNVMPKDGFAEHLIRQAYLNATKAETVLLSQHILDLQKDKGNLTDRVRELEQQNERLKGDLELWESGACRATNLDKCGVVKELEARIERNKIDLAISEHDREHNDYELTEVYKKIEQLEKENKVLAQNLEDTEILNKTYEKRFDDLKKENAELKDDNKVMADNYSKMEQKFYDNLTKAKEIIREFMKYEINEYDGSLEIHFEELKKQAEQFLSEVEK